MTYELVDLEPGDPRLVDDMLPVLRELRTHLDAANLTAIYAEGHPQGLRFLVAYDGDRCVGVAGWRILALTFAVRKLYVDDLVTAAGGRSRGIDTRCWPSWRPGPGPPAARSSTSTRASSGTTRTGSTSASGCTSPRTTSPRRSTGRDNPTPHRPVNPVVGSVARPSVEAWQSGPPGPAGRAARLG